jgi:hypothetical protein
VSTAESPVPVAVLRVAGRGEPLPLPRYQTDGAAGMDLRSGQSFSNLVNVPATTLSGNRVIPFNPDQSALVIQLANGHRSVSTSNQNNIRNWISAGALNN